MTEVIFGVVILALIAFAAWREQEHRAERAELFQRVQAPELAVKEHDRRDQPPPRPARVLISDDERMAQEIRDRDGLSDDG